MDSRVAGGKEAVSTVKWTQIGLDRGQKWCAAIPVQWSALGPLLFTIFINDIDEGVLCEISKISDDTKRAGQINTINDL